MVKHLSGYVCQGTCEEKTWQNMINFTIYYQLNILEKCNAIARHEIPDHRHHKAARVVDYRSLIKGRVWQNKNCVLSGVEGAWLGWASPHSGNSAIYNTGIIDSSAGSLVKKNIKRKFYLVTQRYTNAENGEEDRARGNDKQFVEARGDSGSGARSSEQSLFYHVYVLCLTADLKLRIFYSTPKRGDICHVFLFGNYQCLQERMGRRPRTQPLASLDTLDEKGLNMCKIKPAANVNTWRRIKLTERIIITSLPFLYRVMTKNGKIYIRNNGPAHVSPKHLYVGNTKYEKLKK